MIETEQTDLQGWAADLAAGRRREVERKSLADRKVLSDRALLRRVGPRLWRELVAEVEARLAHLERAVGGAPLLRLVHDQVRTRVALESTATGKELGVLSYQPGEFRLGTLDGTYLLRVQGVAEAVWHEVQYGVTTSQTIAALVVERAFRRLG